MLKHESRMFWFSILFHMVRENGVNSVVFVYGCCTFELQSVIKSKMCALHVKHYS
jgi:hypothetical protein